jgi:hypothetical protein
LFFEKKLKLEDFNISENNMMIRVEDAKVVVVVLLG